MTRTFPTARPGLLSLAFLLAATAPALAQEYTVEDFTGGYTAPPQGAADVIDPGVDDGTVIGFLPFDFVYFGRSYDRVTISSNGWIAFGAITGANSGAVSSNPALPAATAPDGVLAPLWDDLATGSGKVQTFTLGTAPARTFVVSWEGVDTFSGAQTSDLTFQVRLSEAAGTIEFTYATGGTWTGLSYTAGIEDESGSRAFGAFNLANDNSGRPPNDVRFLAKPISLTGTVVRDRPIASATGLGPGVDAGLPVDRCRVVVRREDTGDEIGATETAADGSFSLITWSLDPGDLLSVHLITEGGGARVLDDNARLYEYELAGGLDAAPFRSLGTMRLDAFVDTTDASIRRALNVHQALVHGNALARSFADHAASLDPIAVAEQFGTLTARWADGRAVQGGTQYLAGSETSSPALEVTDVGSNPDPYDDDMLLRTYAEHVFAQISHRPDSAEAGLWSETTVPPSALIDGFGFWFAAVAKGDPVLVDTKSATTADTFDLEAFLPAAPASSSVAGAVASSLWDLVDPANETRDTFDGTLAGDPSTASDVFAVFDRDLDDELDYTIADFFNAWRARRTTDEGRATARVFIRHGALPDDDGEPNDLPGEETAFPLEIQRLDARLLNPADVDRYTFTMPGTDPTELTVTVTQALSDSTAPEFDVQVFDAGSALVAEGTNVGAGDRSTVRVVSPAPVQPGTFTVVITPVSGDVEAAYSITFSAPFTVATAALPAWTAGLPFKEDLAVLGGVPPFLFDVQVPAPGLSPVDGGSRISGTPTSPGDFDVVVQVTDSDAPATMVSRTIPLRINPALALPPFFAVPAGTSLSREIGVGGTAPDWTNTSPNPLGFTISDGPALRITGTGPATGSSFTVTASATDSLGASLDPTTALVVVALPLEPRTDVAVPPGSHIGFYFDGLAGSRADLRLRFDGTGPIPNFVALVDVDGNDVPLAQPAKRNGSVTKLKDVTLPANGRYFLIFENDPDAPNQPFAGRIDVKTDVAPDRRRRGQLGVDAPGTFEEFTFDAVAGAKVDLTVVRGNAPSDLKPRIFAVFGPDGQTLDLSTAKVRSRGKRSKTRGIRITQSGTHRVRVGGSLPTETGPVRWKFKMRVPKDALFSADDLVADDV